MKRLSFTFLLLVLILAGCRPPQESAGASSSLPEEIQGRIELESSAVVGTVPVTVFLLESGSGVTGARVTITGDMTHAGMVPVVRTATEVEPGRYEAADFEFDMGGDWLVTAEVTLGDSGTSRLTLPVTVNSR